MADLGDLMPLAVEIRDDAGVLTNASSVVLTITRPDGTTVLPFITNPPSITGRYVADYLPTQIGRHLVRWVATSPAAAYADTFDVRDHAAQSIMSLTEAKLHLNIPLTVTTDDEELRQFVEAVTRIVERHRNETIPRTVFAESFFTPGAYQILLNHRPVMAVTSIVSGSVSWNPLNWALDREAGTLTLISGGRVYGDVTITYTAGYVAVPAHYILAAKVILGHLWVTQRLATLGPGVGGFGMRSTTSDQVMTPSGLGFAIPPRAVELLGPRPSVIV